MHNLHNILEMIKLYKWRTDYRLPGVEEEMEAEEMGVPYKKRPEGSWKRFVS